MRAKHVQIHCISNGQRYTINRFTAENNDTMTAAKERELLDKAHRMAAAWATVFPDDQILVVAVPPGK